VLAAIFLLGGASKLFVPKEKLAEFHAGRWVEDFSAGSVKALGVLDILAAVGLILPAALDIAPVLVPVAAVGVVLLMLCAVITRINCQLARTIAPDLVYLAFAGFVAWAASARSHSPADRAAFQRSTLGREGLSFAIGWRGFGAVASSC
jgi:uncharacterized membrane protein YphA (DoxX/SURF4 family)